MNNNGIILEREEVNPQKDPCSIGIRTFFIFLDVPRHFEFRAGSLPRLSVKDKVEFDLSLRNPRDPTKTRKISGTYEVRSIRMKYEASKAGLQGLSQYVEWIPVDQ